jgi:hypothetical protein
VLSVDARPWGLWPSRRRVVAIIAAGDEDVQSWGPDIPPPDLAPPQQRPRMPAPPGIGRRSSWLDGVEGSVFFIAWIGTAALTAVAVIAVMGLWWGR